MSFHSDPTANAAIGSINREFSRYEKKAKRLIKLLNEGKITQEHIEKAQSEFTGIYRHILKNTLKEETDKNDE